MFPVKDAGKTMMIAYSGGTLTGGFGADGARWDEYIASQKIAGVAAEAGAAVLLSNHSAYNGAYTRRGWCRSSASRAREIHSSSVRTASSAYFTVMQECAIASKLRAGAK